ncbi:hemolysin activation/secretion protein [Rhodoblastus acidophilus]|uniref:ShlB/FhaC/HecB family hemolysin secretion/activation protein n=1 Tax=Rhodoblastus acidophilus TaxID=1074 RepID=UPI0022248881|nr:ShlB/FhaC/HecB family hemolysin secretion/activation protein [Rhodoblastus acidophilus]MCW2318344.1 hemolysin activation/secretion protein [Rhodoblastus acidophilus]
MSAPARRYLATALCGSGLALLASAPALAQSAAGAVSAAGAASREAEQSRLTQPMPEPAPRLALPQLVEPQLRLDAKQKLLIKSVTVAGEQPLGEEETRAVLAPYEGRKLSMAEIYEMADKLTNLYRSKGYLVAKTYVPAQDARSGQLRLKLLVGQFGAVTVKNESLVNDELVEGTIAQALAGEPNIQQSAIERTLLLTHDLPGAGVPKATISAGVAPGSSDFNFAVPPDPRFAGYVMGDNWGAPSTGRERLSAALSVNSPLSIGDRLDLYGLVSRGSELLNGRVAYSAPLWTTGVRAEVALFKTTYALGAAYSALEAKGIAEGVSGTLTYALQRQQASSLFVSLNGTWKHLHDDVLGVTISEREIGLGTLGLTHEGAFNVFGHALTTSANVSGTGGDVSFVSASVSKAPAGGFGHANVNLSANLALVDALSVAATFKAQSSLGKTLDSSEQFSLTGAWGVRAFDEGAMGDSGVLFTPELRYQLPEVFGVKHVASIFSDVGAAWLAHRDPSGLQPTRTSAQDLGLGYGANWDWMAGRTLFVKAQVAWRFGGDEGASRYRYGEGVKGLVQFGTTF